MVKVVSEFNPAPGRKIGYARVSTADQNPDMQVQALLDYGVPRELIFVDHASGGSMDRPMFIRALKTAQHPETEFVVWKLDRRSRCDDIDCDWFGACPHTPVAWLILNPDSDLARLYRGDL